MFPKRWWNVQVGPCTGIDGGDQLWMSRYILLRLAELYNIDVSPSSICSYSLCNTLVFFCLAPFALYRIHHSVCPTIMHTHISVIGQYCQGCLHVCWVAGNL